MANFEQEAKNVADWRKYSLEGEMKASKKDDCQIEGDDERVDNNLADSQVFDEVREE